MAFASNPLKLPVDGRQSEIVLAIARGTARLLHAHGRCVVSELPLPSGRRADLVALGRPHLVDPAFAMKAAAWYGADNVFCPPQYLPGKEQIFRNSVRDRQEFEELKIKAKPKTRAELKAEAPKPLAAE